MLFPEQLQNLLGALLVESLKIKGIEFVGLTRFIYSCSVA